MNDNLIIFASGTKTGGGSGAEKLVLSSRGETPTPLRANVVAFVSNIQGGGVEQRADKLKVPFIHFVPTGGPLAQAAGYQKLVRDTGAHWVSLSGWLKLAVGLDPRKTINIHPGLLSVKNEDGSPRYGGVGMHGHYVHEASARDLNAGRLAFSGPTMHFVTQIYDRGPIFFEKLVRLELGMTPDQIGEAVNKVEHQYQSICTDKVITGDISWDGKDPSSLKVPADWRFLPRY